MVTQKKTKKDTSKLTNQHSKSTSTPTKIHIVFNVNETERILNPIFTEKPDIIYYFQFSGYVDDKNQTIYDANKASITQTLPNVVIHSIGVNYVEYYDIIGELAKIVTFTKKQYSDPHITVNLGTGSKMVAIAIMDAQRLWDCFDLVYPYSKDYDPKRAVAHQGALVQAEIPHFQFKTPPKVCIQAIQVYYWMRNNERFGRDISFVRRKDWQDYMYALDLLEVQLQNTSPSYNVEQPKTRRMTEAVIKPLEKWDLIERNKDGRTFKIFLTKAGENLARVFEHYDCGVDFKKLHKIRFSNQSG